MKKHHFLKKCNPPSSVVWILVYFMNYFCWCFPLARLTNFKRMIQWHLLKLDDCTSLYEEWKKLECEVWMWYLLFSDTLQWISNCLPAFPEHSHPIQWHKCKQLWRQHKESRLLWLQTKAYKDAGKIWMLTTFINNSLSADYNIINGENKCADFGSFWMFRCSNKCTSSCR